MGPTFKSSCDIQSSAGKLRVKQALFFASIRAGHLPTIQFTPKRFFKHLTSSYNLAQTMHFPFLFVIVALTTSMTSVSACPCAAGGAPCKHDSDCCDRLDRCVTIPTGAQMCWH